MPFASSIIPRKVLPIQHNHCGPDMRTRSASSFRCADFPDCRSTSLSAWLGAFVVVIMLANLACPSLKYLLQRGFCGSGDVRRWNWVHEYIGNSIVEYAPCNV